MEYEVLKPQVVWINGSCYRKNTLNTLSSKSCKGGDTIDDFEDYQSDNLCREQEYGYNESETLSNMYKIENINGRYKCSLQVASAFYAIIIGKQAIMKKRIENETRTMIRIPKQGVENEDIIVSGDSKSGVANACSRILLIVESSRSKMGHTHFISIPMNTKEMQDAQLKFKQEVLQLYLEKSGNRKDGNSCASSRQIDETLFQTPSMLHLTIGALALLDSRERQKACELLEDCKESIVLPLIGTSGITVEVAGLKIMNDDPGDADVIYAQVHPIAKNYDGENVLQILADRIVDKFVASGLMRREYDRVKLHITVMNSIFKKRETNEQNNGNNFQDPISDLKSEKAVGTRESIDATEILEKFGTRNFCTTDIKEMHLSQLKAGRRNEDNYYYPSTVVRFSTCG